MRSYWLDRPHSPTPPPQRDLETQVVVIGGGLCGLSTTWHLASAGVPVVCLEARALASSATGRNAGFILQGTAERYDRAVELMGRERARAIHALSVDNHLAMAAAVEQLGLECEYRKRGSLQLASSPEEEAELTEAARLMGEDGFAAELWTRDQLPPVLADGRHRLGVFLPQDGEIHPVRFTRGLAEAARREGARIHENSPVTALHASQPGDVRVTLESGVQVRAQLAVLATNAHAGQLSDFLADKVDPVRGQMLATAPLPQRFPQPIYANHGYDYWRQTPEGRVVLGGWRNLDPQSEVGHEERLHPGIQERMQDFLERFSWGQALQITHRWSGTMGFSRDGLPLVGALPGQPGALCGVGFTGHGFGFAFLAGQALSGLILEGEHPMARWLSPRRFVG